MRLSILAALSENRVIGDDGKLPWHLPAELARVKELTTGHCLLMGRKTFDSIGRPLPNRTSIVMTRRSGFAPDGVVVVASLAEAVAAARARDEEEAFVFGGASVYAEALPYCERLYLTRVHVTLEGDVRFPEFDEGDWKLIREERHEADGRNAHAFTFQTWERQGEPAPI